MAELSRNAESAQIRGLLARVLRRGRGARLPWFSLGFLLLVVIAGLAGQTIAPHDPNALNLGAAFQPPFWQEGGNLQHLLGTDNLGRDIFSRILAGARITLIVALLSIVFSCMVGALMGLLSGYFGRWVDMLIMRLVDMYMAIPALALALVFAAVLPPGLMTVVVVITLTYWTWYARIIRSEVLSLRERDYVALARVAGCGNAVILRRHLLPNIFNTLLVLASLQVGQVIIFEASLSFLGLGIQSPQVSWGGMLSDARGYIAHAWWLITIPGIAIMLTCLSANLLGDWMRDRFDPKRRQL